MPELPEISILARQLQQEIVGRTIAGLEVLQPKSLNVPPEDLPLSGTEILTVQSHGKWVQIQTTAGWLLVGLGMGGEILLTDRSHLPEKYRLIVDFEDGECLAINFWWFGYFHYVTDLADHPMTASLGPDFMTLSLEDFREILRGRRGGIKAFLLNQKHVAGIGNVYVQDPLFNAGIHPLRTINTLSDNEIQVLWQALRGTLQESIEHGGSHWEQNLYGEHGRWDNSFFQAAYREGQPCPNCGTTIEKIKTGSTSTYICPACQPL
ncbi:MAG: DNA-formamidopyrimidine glycosylase family protein [Anaerolineae bacterium]|jgi:formamidopyrimidine-DNA glycosylase